MPKVNDLKQYTRDVFTKAGLNDETIKQVLKEFDNEQALKTFAESFKPQPDYSHDLDQVRTKAKEEKDAEYADWFGKEQTKYQEYVNGLTELERYRQQYGKPGERAGNEGTSMTQEEINRLVQSQLQTQLETVLSRRDQAYLAFRDADWDHQKRFGKPMDRQAFEDTWKKNPQWGGDLFGAYEKWIAPEVDKAREAEWETKLKAKYEEGIRDGFTRKTLPTDHQPKEFSPLFDRKEDVAKLGERESETHSREAFFAGLREGK